MNIKDSLILLNIYLSKKGVKLIEILKEHFKEEIEAEKLGPSMATKQISDVEAFVQETEEARRIPLSKEDIENINNLSREVEN